LPSISGVSILMAVLLLVSSPAWAIHGNAQVRVRVDSTSTTSVPFPSDLFSVRDFANNTRIRVDLPFPDCAARPSDCADIAVINTLDGFNVQPRLSIPFDGAIDVDSVDGDSVFLLKLEDTLDFRDRGGEVIGINQIVWDPDADTLHVESDAQLEQHTRYALVVTRSVRDASGDPIGSSLLAQLLDRQADGHYRSRFVQALIALLREGRSFSEIAALSVFTTQSVTSDLEKIRVQLDQTSAVSAPTARFDLGEDGSRTVFPLSEVAGISLDRQVGTGPDFSMSTVPAFLLNIVPGALGTVAFGKYESPDYRNEDRFIPAVGTRFGQPEAQATNEVFFNLFVPAGEPPPGGWPVALFGHGFGDSKQGAPFVVPAVLADSGIATIAINVVGHGGGPLGTLTVVRPGGDTVRFPAGGRGQDVDGDGDIESTEGVDAAPTQGIISNRDGLRQTVVDLMQLVRVISAGMDVDGDGADDLSRERIFYFGQSFGGIYGTKLIAVDPKIEVGVPNVAGGAIIEIARLSPIFRPLVGIALASRVPSLINIGGISFDENLPLRNQPAVTNDVPGAIAIQRVIDDTEWVSQSGNPVAYATHLLNEPLRGNSEKKIIFQFAKGDMTVPNPTNTAIIRAGGLTDRTTFLRNDLAAAAGLGVPTNPHTFLTNLTSPAEAPFGFLAQGQIATFFATDGEVVIDPDGPGPLFEVPIEGPLPEELNFLP
jgi:hypothetical protein